jgi:hypothetical protein
MEVAASEGARPGQGVELDMEVAASRGPTSCIAPPGDGQAPGV